MQLQFHPTPIRKCIIQEQVQNSIVETQQKLDWHTPGRALLRKGVSIHETWRLWTFAHLQDLLLLPWVASNGGGSYTI
jgi:hypothetical protein